MMYNQFEEFLKPMTKTIEAIYENGVFRPLDAVDLPDKSKVEIDLHLNAGRKAGPTDDKSHLQFTLPPGEWIKQVREWAKRPRKIAPSLPDEALRRASIYEDRY